MITGIRFSGDWLAPWQAGLLRSRAPPTPDACCETLESLRGSVLTERREAAGLLDASYSRWQWLR